MNKIILALAFILFTQVGFTQKNVEVAVVGFYNLENLFDTINDLEKNDEDFLPTGSYKYNSKVYHEKLGNLSSVLSQIGTEISPDGAALIGVCEIENRSVLVDLVKQKSLQDRNYQIVHYDSPDERGIDVGLLYNPKYFKEIESKNLFVQLPERDGEPNYTRDVLWVSGNFLGEEMHVFVNHWPSRRGGEAKSSPLREMAAAVAKKKIDEIIEANPNAKIILMGDLNDDPVNKSVKKVIGAWGNKDGMTSKAFYNPWMSMYKNGIGTLAYRDAWNLFDQIIVSGALVNKNAEGFQFYKAKIFKRPEMLSTEGQYKGYPKRTYSFGTYVGGFSDHLPTYIVLVREADDKWKTKWQQVKTHSKSKANVKVLEKTKTERKSFDIPAIEFYDLPYLWDSRINNLQTCSKEKYETKATTKVVYVFKGQSSKTKFENSKEVSVLVKSDIQPSLFKIYKMDVGKKDRKVEIMTASIGKVNTQSEDEIDFNVKKHQNEVYELVFSSNLSKGEYLILIGANAYTFSVG